MLVPGCDDKTDRNADAQPKKSNQKPNSVLWLENSNLLYREIFYIRAPSTEPLLKKS